MKIENESQLDDIARDLETIQTRYDASREEAINLLMIQELRQVKEAINDIETHTNNTVRKL